MKQLNVMGSRRHFFRSPRRAMRPLRPGLGSHDDLGDSPEMVGGPSNSFGYFSGQFRGERRAASFSCSVQGRKREA